MPEGRRPNAYIPELDALRAIAVIAVMIYHLRASWLPGGYAGVDVFFAISGYVISRSLYDSRGERWPDFMLQFYARRLLRIVPALVVCLFVTAGITTLFIPRSWLSSTTPTTAKLAFLGLSNYALVQKNDAYFDPRAEYNPFTHTWSLGIEEQFYVVFPSLLFVWLAWRMADPRRRRIGTAILPVLFALSLLYSAYVTRAAPLRAYYELPSRFWELTAGVMLFQLQITQTSWSSRWSSGLRLAQLGAGVLLVGVTFWLADQSAFPFPWALAAILGTVCMIDALLAEPATPLAAARWFESPVLVWIGKRSYSIYLWHWPIFVLMRWTVGLERWWIRSAALTLVALLAMASYRWVETPIRRAPAFRCADWFDRMNPVCEPGLSMDRAQLLTVRAPMMQSMTQLTRSNPNVVLWDPFDLLCPGQRCQAIVGDKPLFLDSDHLSGHVNEVLYPSFAQTLSDMHTTATASAE